ncbi:MAG: hypothetical protein ABIM49_03795 [candidate division WOR-3 bacterium]
MEILSFKINMYDNPPQGINLKFKISAEKITFFLSKVLSFLKLDFNTEFIKEMIKGKYLLLEGEFIKKYVFKVLFKIV